MTPSISSPISPMNIFSLPVLILPPPKSQQRIFANEEFNNGKINHTNVSNKFHPYPKLIGSKANNSRLHSLSSNFPDFIINQNNEKENNNNEITNNNNINNIKNNIISINNINNNNNNNSLLNHKIFQSLLDSVNDQECILSSDDSSIPTSPSPSPSPRNQHYDDEITNLTILSNIGNVNNIKNNNNNNNNNNSLRNLFYELNNYSNSAPISFNSYNNNNNQTITNISNNNNNNNNSKSISTVTPLDCFRKIFSNMIIVMTDIISNVRNNSSNGQVPTATSTHYLGNRFPITSSLIESFIIVSLFINSHSLDRISDYWSTVQAKVYPDVALIPRILSRNKYFEIKSSLSSVLTTNLIEQLQTVVQQEILNANCPNLESIQSSKFKTPVKHRNSTKELASFNLLLEYGLSNVCDLFNSDKSQFSSMVQIVEMLTQQVCPISEQQQQQSPIIISSNNNTNNNNNNNNNNILSHIIELESVPTPRVSSSSHSPKLFL